MNITDEDHSSIEKKWTDDQEERKAGPTHILLKINKNDH
jgi:hypothetical protein